MGDEEDLKGDGEELYGHGNTSVLVYLHNYKMRISLCSLSRCNTY